MPTNLICFYQTAGGQRQILIRAGDYVSGTAWEDSTRPSPAAARLLESIEESIRNQERDDERRRADFWNRLEQLRVDNPKKWKRWIKRHV